MEVKHEFGGLRAEVSAAITYPRGPFDHFDLVKRSAKERLGIDLDSIDASEIFVVPDSDFPPGKGRNTVSASMFLVFLSYGSILDRTLRYPDRLRPNGVIGRVFAHDLLKFWNGRSEPDVARVYGGRGSAQDFFFMALDLIWRAGLEGEQHW